MRFPLLGLGVAVLVGLAGCRPPGWGKEPPPDAPDVTPDGADGTDAPPDTSSVATCEHSFRLDGYTTATSVWLTGSFVAWATTPGAGAIAFAQGVDGAWTGTYAFEAGSHQYKFIVDGSNWILDPTNQNTADDGMGHTNSVYTCVP